MITIYCTQFLLVMILLHSKCSVDAQFIFIPPPPLGLEYDGYGTRLAVNDHLAVLAQNDKNRFTVMFGPHNTSQPLKCYLPYPHIEYNSAFQFTRFIYGVAIGAKQNSSHLVFAVLAEDALRDVYLSVITLGKSDKGGCVLKHIQSSDELEDLEFSERAIVGMDPYGTRAYAVGILYTYYIDIALNMIDNLHNHENTFIGWLPLMAKAIAISEDQRIFIVGQALVNKSLFLPYLCIIQIHSPYTADLLATIQLSSFDFGEASIHMTRYSSMSVGIDDEGKQVIVGIPHQDKIILLRSRPTNLSSLSFEIILSDVSSQGRIMFGKSVAFLDKNTYAVLAMSLATSIWSKSQVQVFSTEHNGTIRRPLFVLPNNQQAIEEINLVPLPYSILTLVTWGQERSSLGFVVDAGAAFLMPVSFPGHYTSHIVGTNDVGIYFSLPCIAGTARNTSSVGPCFICPSGMKAAKNTENANLGSTVCESCANTSGLCLRGSMQEIESTVVTSYNQAYPYPESPESTEFDDVLLQNVFKFMTKSPRCLVISPLFWASVSLSLGLTIFTMTSILICFPKLKPQRTLLKKVFIHLDLIGEGELWLGGLVSLSIVVLIALACKFSHAFYNLYPIEETLSDARDTVSCDSSLLNAKFTSSLQMLSTSKHIEEQPIFKMLDSQKIILTVQFISTGFPCQSIGMQRNMGRGQRIVLHNFNCSLNNETGILIVSTVLPQHLISMQFTLTGPYFVGGLRVCFAAPSSVQSDGIYLVQSIDVCSFFFAHNQTLTLNPTVDVKMTKVINRTAGLFLDNVVFGGRWQPTFTVSTLSDEVLFEQIGEHVRYIPHQLTLVIDVAESEFYINNMQEPIAHQYEIIFSTLLFSTLCIELFGLLFLVIKLAIVPLIRLVQRRYSGKKNSSLELAQFAQQLDFERRVEDILVKLSIKNNTLRSETGENLNSFLNTVTVIKESATDNSELLQNHDIERIRL